MPALNTVLFYVSQVVGGSSDSLGDRAANGLQEQKHVPGTACKPKFHVMIFSLNSRLGLVHDCQPNTWVAETGR